MTATKPIDKQILAAFADGELSPEEAAEVVLYLADRPQDQAWVDDLMAANLAIARAFSGPAEDTVPKRFVSLILPEEAATMYETNVLRFKPQAGRQSGRRTYVASGAAAGLAAAVAAVLFLPDNSREKTLTSGPVDTQSAFAVGLDTQPSGETRQISDMGQLTILASMPSNSGYCREAELVSPDRMVLTLALACREGSTWMIDVVLTESVRASAHPDQVFEAAAGGDLDTLGLWLDRRGAGAAMTPDEEAEAIANDWQG